MKYKEFQGYIEAHSEHLGTLTRETITIESYSQVLDTRISNQNKLLNCLQIMLQGVELTPQEKKLLSEPPFDSDDGIKSCEDVLEKISNFLKFSNDQSTQIRAVREQLQKIQTYLSAFMNKFKENLKRQSKIIFQSQILEKKKSNEDDAQETSFKLADTQLFRKMLMQQRRTIIFLLDCLPDQRKQIITEIGQNMQQFVGNSALFLEQTWNSQMPQLKLYQSKITFWNAAEKIVIDNNSNNFIELIRDIKMFGFVGIVQSLLEQTKSQIETDEAYWLKFFKFSREEKEEQILQRQQVVSEFMASAYKSVFKKISDLFIQASTYSPLLGYLIEQAIINSKLKNIKGKDDEDEDEEEEQNQNNKSNESAIYVSFSQTLYSNLEQIRKDNLKNYENYLKSLDVNTRHSGVLAPVKHISLCVRLISNFITDQNSFCRDILFLNQRTLEWLKVQAGKKQKYNDIVLLVNSHHLYSSIEKINLVTIKELSVKIFQIYKQYSGQYCQYLFCYQFMKFCDHWFKIKDLKPAELESQKFNKSSFLKTVSSTFSNFNKSLESIIKRMNKHLVKDQYIIMKQLKNLMDYVEEEYGELEQFCNKVMGSKPNPQKKQLTDAINAKIDQNILGLNE